MISSKTFISRSWIRWLLMFLLALKLCDLMVFTVNKLAISQDIHPKYSNNTSKVEGYWRVYMGLILLLVFAILFLVNLVCNTLLTYFLCGNYFKSVMIYFLRELQSAWTSKHWQKKKKCHTLLPILLVENAALSYVSQWLPLTLKYTVKHIF